MRWLKLLPFSLLAVGEWFSLRLLKSLSLPLFFLLPTLRSFASLFTVGNERVEGVSTLEEMVNAAVYIAMLNNWKRDQMQLWLGSLWRRDGRALTDDEIAGMLIGLLLAGQHTSSTTSAWLGFFLARDKSIQEQCYAEQKAVCGDDLPPLNYDQVCMLR